MPSNGLPVSRRERRESLSKTARSRARSGRLHGRVRPPVEAAQLAACMCRPHRHRTTPAQRAFGRNHTQHTIRLPTTGAQNNGPSSHTLHNGRPHAARPAQRASSSAIRRILITKEWRPRRHGGRTGCRLAAASARKVCQNATDLAREAVGYSGVLGGSLAAHGRGITLGMSHTHSGLAA